MREGGKEKVLVQNSLESNVKEKKKHELWVKKASSREWGWK